MPSIELLEPVAVGAVPSPDHGRITAANCRLARVVVAAVAILVTSQWVMADSYTANSADPSDLAPADNLSGAPVDVVVDGE